MFATFQGCRRSFFFFGMPCCKQEYVLVIFCHLIVNTLSILVNICQCTVLRTYLPTIRYCVRTYIPTSWDNWGGGARRTLSLRPCIIVMFVDIFVYLCICVFVCVCVLCLRVCDVCVCVNDQFDLLPVDEPT